jgi:hypothetical protein
MGATARTVLLLPLAALAGCASLMGYHPQEWYDARAARRQEMNERVPRSEPRKSGASMSSGAWPATAIPRDET